jgi:hypothetical protein
MKTDWECSHVADYVFFPIGALRAVGTARSVTPLTHPSVPGQGLLAGQRSDLQHKPHLGRNPALRSVIASVWASGQHANLPLKFIAVTMSFRHRNERPLIWRGHLIRLVQKEGL